MKKIKILSLIGCLIIPMLMIAIYQYLSVPSNVVSSEVINSHQYKLFYRSDCKDCHQLFKHSLLQLKLKDTLFIDVSKKENKKYCEDYAIVFVPTLYVGDKEYMGVQDIQKILR